MRVVRLLRSIGPMPSESPRLLRFGEFELRLVSGELLRDGEPVALQRRPARVLETLVRRPGRTVLRREIREAVWGPDAHVDADQSINYCIRQIRVALDDHADDPRYIQTVPRRGYRFIAPVEEVSEPEAGSPPARDASRLPPSAESSAARVVDAVGPVAPIPTAGVLRRRLGGRLLGAALVVLLGIGTVFVLRQALGDGQSSDRSAERAVRDGTSGPEPGEPFAPRAPLVIPEEAHDRYLEARYLLDRASPAQFPNVGREAIELLDLALSEAPEFAPAWGALAEAWLYRLDVPRPEAMRQAGRAARTALELDPGLCKAHEILATTHLFLRLDWGASVRHVRSALETDPRSTDALFLRALVLSAAGRHRQAIATARRTIELEPGKLQIASLGWLQFFARNFEQAIQEADRVLELVPSDVPSHRVKVYAALELGDEESASAELERSWRLETGAPPEQAPPWDGVADFFRRRLEEQRAAEGWVNPAVEATFAVYAGLPGEALEPLVRGCEERSSGWDLPFVRVDPRWDPVRDAPGFSRLLDCVGKPEEAIDPLLRPLASSREALRSGGRSPGA